LEELSARLAEDIEKNVSPTFRYNAPERLKKEGESYILEYLEKHPQMYKYLERYKITGAGGGGAAGELQGITNSAEVTTGTQADTTSVVRDSVATPRRNTVPGDNTNVAPAVREYDPEEDFWEY
jgi:hypothetical protein